ARRDEVYAAAFTVGARGALRALRETAALAAADVPTWLGDPGGRLWLVGEGAAALEAAFEAAGTPGVRRPGPPFDRPSAAAVARLAAARLAAGQTEDVAAFEPFYLKEFVAKKPKASIFER